MSTTILDLDPTKPCRRRNGKKIVQIVELVRPTRISGNTIFALDEDGVSSTNQPNGRFLNLGEGEHLLDLFNISEEVTMVSWMVVDPKTGRRIGPWDSEEDARAHMLNSWEIVVRMTGVYTR